MRAVAVARVAAERLLFVGDNVTDDVAAAGACGRRP